jgi:hypothetical protein
MGTDLLILTDSAVNPPLNMQARSTAPSNPVEGSVYLDDGTNTTSTDPAFRLYTSATWVDLGGGSGGADADAIHDNASGEIAAITEKASPVAGDLLLIEDSEASNAKKRVQIGNLPTGASLPVADTTSIVEGSGDPTKELRIEVDGLTTGTTRVWTAPDTDLTVTGEANAATLTNKTLDADNNTVSNIGAAEIKQDIIDGLTGDSAPTASTDYVMVSVASTGLRKTLIEDLPVSGSGAFVSCAVLRDEKSDGTNGGSASASTWNARDLQTEVSDPDSIVTISSNQFTPISGNYLIMVTAGGLSLNGMRLRLYNVTGTAAVEEGLNAGAASGASILNTASLVSRFTANGTDAYRIEHYATSTKATDGLGAALGDTGSNEVYMEIVLLKYAA